MSPDVYTGPTLLAIAQKEGWPNARLQSRGISTWPDGTVLTGPWVEVPS